MIDIKIAGPSGTKEADKAKKARRPTDPNAPSFSSMLDAAEAEGLSAANSPASLGGVAHVGMFVPEQDIPQDSQGHSRYLLEQLESLERDVLTGSPSVAAANLKRALAALPTDTVQLSDKQQKIVDELQLRASVEVAKLENV
ncbi:MAG: flagellar assembly protein FliX [Alphaproteobacteria bacterium]